MRVALDRVSDSGELVLAVMSNGTNPVNLTSAIWGKQLLTNQSGQMRTLAVQYLYSEPSLSQITLRACQIFWNACVSLPVIFTPKDIHIDPLPHMEYPLAVRHVRNLIIYPNVFGPNDSWWRAFLRHLELMFWFVVGPELVIAWAFRGQVLIVWMSRRWVSMIVVQIKL